MISMNGNEYRTLQDEMFVNGRKVYQVWTNGTMVYPDDDYKYEVSGTVKIDLERTRAYETWVMPDWWNAEMHIDVRFKIQSRLPIYRMRYSQYESVLMALSGFDGITYRGFAAGKIEHASFGRYISGHWGATDRSEWYRYQSTQSDLVEQESLRFGNESTVIRGETVGLENAAHVNGVSYTPVGLMPANTSQDLNHGSYTMMWPDEERSREEGGSLNTPLRIGWNGSDVYSTFNGGQGNRPGSIMTRNTGTCSTAGSPCPWSGIDEWAEQWLREYRNLYG